MLYNLRCLRVNRNIWQSRFLFFIVFLQIERIRADMNQLEKHNHFFGFTVLFPMEMILFDVWKGGEDEGIYKGLLYTVHL